MVDDCILLVEWVALHGNAVAILEYRFVASVAFVMLATYITTMLPDCAINFELRKNPSSFSCESECTISLSPRIACPIELEFDPYHLRVYYYRLTTI